MAGSNAFAWAALAASAVLTTAVLYRVVGPAAYGIWATIMALRAFALFLDGGLLFGAARAAARYSSDPGAAVESVRASTRLALICGLTAAAASIGLAWLPGVLLGLDSRASVEAAGVMILIGVEAGLALFTSPLNGAARGLERFDAIAGGAMIQGLIGVGLVVLLTPTIGIIGAALSLLVARVIGVTPIVATLWSRDARFIGVPGRVRGIRHSFRFAAPLWLIAMGSQVGLGTDVPIVGWFFGATAAGAYAIGAMVPATALALLYSLTDAAYPRIARREESDAGLVGRLVAAATMLAGLGFAVLFILAPQVLVVWIGTADSLTVAVLRIYCCAWACNVPAHVLALHAIARSSHRVLVPVVLGEALASVMLSLLLASIGLPAGPALATLVTLAISNLLIVPWLLLAGTGIAIRAFVPTVVYGYLVGVTTGAMVAGVAVLPGFPAVLTLIVATAFTLMVAAGIVEVTIRRPGAIARLTSILRNRGILTWIRQRREVVAGRARLDRLRSAHPVVWIPSAAPLVSVRIATYNRGPIVRDRAIASALAQTYPNIEIVVVGDRCDEATEAAVRSVRDPRVRFENLAERGTYPADPHFRWMVAGSTPMNRALDLARGEWIAPLDDDDEFTPDHVEVLLDACRSRELEFAYGIAEMEIRPGTWETVGSAPLRHEHIVHAAVLFWRGLGFIRHDLDAWRLHEPGDWNVWRRMRDVGARIGFVDHVVTRHYLERRDVR